MKIKKNKIKKNTQEEYDFLKHHFVHSNIIEALRKIDIDKKMCEMARKLNI